jgi:hypothetical protein
MFKKIPDGGGGRQKGRNKEIIVEIAGAKQAEGLQPISQR